MSASLPPDVDRSAALLSSFWIPFPFTFLFICTRLYSRVLRKDLGLDDFLIVVAWVLYLIGLCLSTVMVRHGGLRHIQYLTMDQLEFVLKMEIVDQPFGVLSAMFGKISVALFICRVMGATAKYRRYIVYVNIAIYVALSFVNIGVLFGQCKPTAALWTPALAAAPSTKCLDASINTDLSILQAAFGAWIDFFLALLPLTFILKLKVSVKKRMVLCALLGLGLVACVCACIKAAQFSKSTNNPDATWATYSVYLWASLELPFVIIAASIPPSKPVWDAIFNGKPIRLDSNTYKNSKSSGHSGLIYRFGRSQNSQLKSSTASMEENVGETDVQEKRNHSVV
ncbi:hypothetical protein N7504_000931 [Penicillium tannophilum]|nr:hypothetical protein N7504_000931 [Penicillium tannophilum]